MVDVFSTRIEKENAVQEFMSSGKRFLYIYGPPASGKSYCVRKWADGKRVMTIEDDPGRFETIINNEINDAEIVFFHGWSYNPAVLRRYPGTTVLEFDIKETIDE